MGDSVPLAEAMVSPVNIVGGFGYSFWYLFLGKEASFELGGRYVLEEKMVDLGAVYMYICVLS